MGRTKKKKIICLCVDAFGVKYFSKDYTDHLLSSFKNYYAILTDWEGRNYLGLTINWNYNRGYVDILIPEYATKALEQLQHPNPKRPQYAPHFWTVPAYVKRLKMAPAPNESDLPDKENTKKIQSIVGTLLYYARSVDTAMLQEINEISRVKSKPTKDTDTKASMLLDYASTYQNAAI